MPGRQLTSRLSWLTISVDSRLNCIEMEIIPVEPVQPIPGSHPDESQIILKEAIDPIV